MLQSLQKVYLNPNTFLNQNFYFNAGENARGIRFILDGFKDFQNFKFKNIIKINNEIFENEEVTFNKEKGFVDVIFPCLESGNYLTELEIIEEEKTLLSGVFSLNYFKSLKDSASTELKKVINFDKFNKLLDLEKNLDKLIEKTSDIEEIVDKNFVFTQINPSSLWEIKHNLNKFPSVTITDSGGNLIIGDIVFLDKNNILLQFNFPFSGKVFLN